MASISSALAGVAGAPTSLPEWVVTTPYVGAAHPRRHGPADLTAGANCQRYAYAILALFGLEIPPHRSSELWEDSDLVHVQRRDAQDLDLVLFSATGDAWGAHIAVVVGACLLHLCAEIGRPALWHWDDFAARERYSEVVGLVRVHRHDG